MMVRSDPDIVWVSDGISRRCATLTPSNAPETARLLRAMGYRIHHSPEDGHVWEWRHPRHRQNNRWETGSAHTATATEAWQDALRDATQKAHPRHEELLRAMAIEHERWVLHQALEVRGASDDRTDDSVPSPPRSPRRL